MQIRPLCEQPLLIPHMMNIIVYDNDCLQTNAKPKCHQTNMKH